MNDSLEVEVLYRRVRLRRNPGPEGNNSEPGGLDRTTLSGSGLDVLEGRAFILAALHLPRRGTPTRLLGQRYGLEVRPRRRGPAR
jgi:hypothetical protein